MHAESSLATVVVPHAAGPAGDDGRPRWTPPALPRLSALLAALRPAGRDEASLYHPNPPHERALAQAWGWPASEGQLPFGPALAEDDRLALDPALPWGLLQPVHWAVGRDHVVMADPEGLKLDVEASLQFFQRLEPLFASEGWDLRWGAPGRWYLGHPSLEGLATASPDRVIGRNPDLWMPDGPAGRTFRRLQAEVQMSLHQHPLNEAREAAGLPAVNSVWLSGCGRPRPRAGELHLLEDLRGPALAGDEAAWARTWHMLDGGSIARLLRSLRAGRGLRLVLCGERHAERFESPGPGLGARLGGWLGRLRGGRSPAAVLGSL